MKISVITIVLNDKGYLEETIRSVLEQSHADLEYIVIDGGSADGSLEIIKKHEEYLDKWVSEPDSGIYDAMNKGIALSTGNVIGFLNSGDIYFSKDIVKKVSDVIEKEGSDCCYGDIVYVSEDLKNIIRYWMAGAPGRNLFRKGWMPPHPSFFVKRAVFDKSGLFRTDFKISADYELMLRFFEKENISASYIPDLFVKMRIGGKSNSGFRNLLRKSYEDLRAWKVNGLRIDPMIVIRKPFSKFTQFFKKVK